jgi:undecaprenyl-diphosphatase
MNYLSSILGGLVQGFATILPISENGHRLLLEKVGQAAPSPLLSIACGAAILLAFRKTLRQTAQGVGKALEAKKKGRFRPSKATHYQKMAVFAPLAALPYWILLVLQRYFGLLGGALQSTAVAGAMFLATAGLLYLGEHSLCKKYTVADMSGGQAFKLGLFQAVSILPGLSRTALTYCMGRNMGYERNAALEFSFMTMACALLGGELITLPKTIFEIGPVLPWLASFGAAFAAAFGACLLVRWLAEKEKLGWLGIYCILAAVAVIVF